MSLKRVGEILESLPGLACPHCGAGRDAQTVGLVWDSIEQNWRCLICECRIYEGTNHPKPRPVSLGSCCRIPIAVLGCNTFGCNSD